MNHKFSFSNKRAIVLKSLIILGLFLGLNVFFKGSFLPSVSKSFPQPSKKDGNFLDIDDWIYFNQDYSSPNHRGFSFRYPPELEIQDWDSSAVWLKKQGDYYLTQVATKEILKTISISIQLGLGKIN